MHFQPMECTFATPAEFCQSFHCLVAVGIFEQTDRNVSGINMLNRMRIVSVDFYEQSESLLKGFFLLCLKHNQPV